MFPIKLPILCHDEVSKQLKEMGIDTDFAELKRSIFVFFYIDYMAQMHRDGIEYTEVIVDDRSFVCDLKIEEIYKLLNDK